MKKDHGLHWGLVSTYRQEIMGIACLWVILHHNFCKWPNALELVRELGICLSHVMLKNAYLYYFPVTQWDRWGFLSYGLVVAIALIISTIVHPIGKWICNCLQKS